MPELIEVERYRRSLDGVRGWTVVAMPVIDPLVVPDPAGVRDLLIGSSIIDVGRHGKVVYLTTGHGVVGLHFGMTGRIIVGDDDPIPTLAYGPSIDNGRFDRWVLVATAPDGGRNTTLRLSDARRLARVRPDQNRGLMGPDASTVMPGELIARLRGRRSAIKTALLDQRVIAGLGNLLADEVLWRSGIAPDRRSCDVSDDEYRRLVFNLPRVLEELNRRGGSHLGDLSVSMRRAGTRCPLDGDALARRIIGGRTSWFCPTHQR